MNASRTGNGAAEVLSAADGGDLAAGEEARKFVCLLSDGRLLVADGHWLNTHVQSYRYQLERLGHPYVYTPVELTVIRQVYEGARPERVDYTGMQVEAKQLLERACKERASDIHIRVGRYDSDIHFRVHNDLVKMVGHSREYGQRLCATLYGSMTDVSDTVYSPLERQDARIGERQKLPERLYGVRIATAPTVDGCVMVLRLLYDDAGDSCDPRALGFSDEQTALLQTLKERPVGITLISGPTGSGKSTTLQRLLTAQLREAAGRIHLVTVEDPPEYPIEGAAQTPVANAKSGGERAQVFSEAIANAMRLDPDVIMIGEIRDHASAQLAMRAAMTGHQVWTTVHAVDALAIIDRLTDLEMPLNLLADPTVLSGLVSQRLVKVLCPACKIKLAGNEGLLPVPVLNRLAAALGSQAKDICVAGPGCGCCGGHGTAGRSVVAEIIVPDEQFFAFVRAGNKVQARQYWLRELNGVTLMEHALQKVAAGLVDPRMAERVVGRLERVRRKEDPLSPVSSLPLPLLSHMLARGSYAA